MKKKGKYFFIAIAYIVVIFIMAIYFYKNGISLI